MSSHFMYIRNPLHLNRVLGSSSRTELIDWKIAVIPEILQANIANLKSD